MGKYLNTGTRPASGDTVLTPFVKLFDKANIAALDSAVNDFLDTLQAADNDFYVRDISYGSYSHRPKSRHTAMVFYVVVG